MKPEDFKVGGLYTWRKDFDWRLESNGGEAGPFLVTSITDEVWSDELDTAGAVSYTCLDLIGPSGRTLEWEISIARCMQPLE